MTNPKVMETLAQTMLAQDVHLYYGRPTQTLIRRINAINRMKPGKGGPYNEIKYPPNVFFTLDDNYDVVHPFNESFMYNGHKLPDGTPILPGDEVKCQLTDGTIVTLWKEGALYGAEKFDAERNRQDIGQMNKILGQDVSGCYFTTDRLSDYYRGIGFKNVYTYPNSIYFPDYEQLKDFEMVRKDKTRIKVLWQGGSSHYEDWYAIREALKETVERFPEVDWLIWGTKFNWIHDVIPPERCTFLPWQPYEAYKLMLQTIDFDFMVAPLSRNLFNDGKSAIKFYEPAALGNPKPTLAAAVPPYSDEMIHDETGLLYQNPKDFVEQFGRMVGDAALRKRLAENAHTWVRENRDAMKTTVGFYEWLMETREASKQKWGGKNGLSDLLAKAGQSSGNSGDGEGSQSEIPGESPSPSVERALEPKSDDVKVGAV